MAKKQRHKAWKNTEQNAKTPQNILREEKKCKLVSV